MCRWPLGDDPVWPESWSLAELPPVADPTLDVQESPMPIDGHAVTAIGWDVERGFIFQRSWRYGDRYYEKPPKKEEDA
jgi:hypothetical protein